MGLDLAPSRVCRTPADTLVFAIGDMTARPASLAAILQDLAPRARASARDQLSCIVVAFGGFAQDGLAEQYLAFEQAAGCAVRPILSPADAAVLELLEGADDLGPDALALACDWLIQRGGAVPGASVEALRAALTAATSPPVLALLRRGARRLQLGDYAFVYDRLDPYRPMPLDDLLAMLRARYTGPARAGAWPGVGVTGHTVTAERVIQTYHPPRAGDATGVLQLQGEACDYLWYPSEAEAFAAALSRTETPDDAEAVIRTLKPSPLPAALAPMGLGVAALVGVLAAAVSLQGQQTPAGPPPTPAALPPAGKAAPLHVAALQISPQTPLPSRRDGADRLALRQAQAVASETSLASQPAPAPAPATEAPDFAEPSAPAAEPATQPPGGARVQIAAVASQAEAEARFADLAAAFPEALVDRRLETSPVTANGRRLQRTLVAGFASTADAEAFCRTLQAAGRDCLVRRAR